MFSNTTVLDHIVAARAEGGNARAIEEAKTLVEQNFPDAGEVDVETPVNRILNALDRFDRDGALAAITEAMTAIEAIGNEEDSADEDDEDEDDSEESTGEDLATRVATLEKGFAELRQVAVSRGLL